MFLCVSVLHVRSMYVMLQTDKPGILTCTVQRCGCLAPADSKSSLVLIWGGNGRGGGSAVGLEVFLWAADDVNSGTFCVFKTLFLSLRKQLSTRAQVSSTAVQAFT